MFFQRSFTAAIVFAICAFAHEAVAEPKQDSKEIIPQKNTLAAKINDLQNDSSENPREAALQVMDMMIAIDKRLKYTDDIAELKSFRDEFAINQDVRKAISICENSLEMLKGLRDISELRIADELSSSVLRLALCLKKDAPKLYLVANQQAAQLDVDFERYDSALDHLAAGMKNPVDEPVVRHELIASQAQCALVLRKLKRFDEADQIYSDLLRKSNNKDKALSDDDLYKLRFARAMLQAEKGEFQKYATAIPDAGHKATYENGVRDYTIEVLKATVAVNYNLTKQGDIKLAAEEAQQLVEWTKQHYGVSSRRHIEAIELLAKVRITQSQFDDAVALLKQSSELRAGLLGKDHPSVARVNKEIDAAKSAGVAVK